MASRKKVSQGLVQHTKLVQTEESILPIFFKNLFVTRYLFKIYVSLCPDFLPVQTNIIEALILLRLSYRWSHKFRHYLPVDLLKVHLCDQDSLVVKDKLNLTLSDKRSLAQVPIFLKGLSPWYWDGVNQRHQIKNVFSITICTASIELKNKLVILLSNRIL